MTHTDHPHRTLTLFSYFRSSAAYRVRIALNLKQIPHDIVPVHLIRDGGQHRLASYAAVNPQMRVPALRVDEAGRAETLIQSSAILEWIEEEYPDPPLLPADPFARARCRAIAAIVGSDIHPLNNLSALAALTERFGADEAGRRGWYAKWVTEGFDAIEALLGDASFASGDTPGMADLYLVPQVFNARRFEVDLTRYPKIVACDRNCLALDSFQQAAPERQPDAG